VKWVVDASVAAKWLAPEAESEHAAGLLDAHLLVPDLLFAEVANVLWKKQRRAEIDSNTAAAAMRWLTHAPLHVHENAPLASAALALAVRLGHPAYDCIYLALALRERCTLVTADRRFARRCERADAKDLASRVVWLPAWREGAAM